ncbi:MAG TPA: 4Fe-4S dicluster domain-containing protein [Thermoprotei archaeon]|nr:MAG: ferredoxin [Thermoprotei archaeon]HDJ89851.1 4Fe-4S dicluster domain-containing protein [Thermoprotei archaeon]
MPFVKVNHEKCIGCGECYKVCPSKVFVIRRGKSYPVRMDECVMCRACITHCPTNAITISHREVEKKLSRLYE